ncbi:hypothetical protein GLYMA_09G093300v4 [Glycine max]|nr:hypothetical protein GLYMA_09G093300v4 [Glycine max]KAH1042237.1 hypothetical protein GYH30_024519 [Glycine max]
MIVCYPVSYPVGKVLDHLVGHNEALFRRAELKALVSIHGQEMGFQFPGKAVYSVVWIVAFSLFMEFLGFSTHKWYCRDNTMSLRRFLGYSDGGVMRSDAKPCFRLMRHIAAIFSVGGAFGFWVLCRMHYVNPQFMLGMGYAT